MKLLLRAIAAVLLGAAVYIAGEGRAANFNDMTSLVFVVALGVCAALVLVKSRGTGLWDALSWTLLAAGAVTAVFNFAVSARLIPEKPDFVVIITLLPLLYAAVLSLAAALVPRALKTA